MVNNQKLNKQIVEALSDLPYEIKVNTFDTNCKGCPFARYVVIFHTHYTHLERKVLCNNDLEFAIHAAWKVDGYIERSCMFNGAPLSLNEVVSNTCKFWDAHTCEDNETEFVEVDNPEELCLKINILKI